MKRTMIQRMAAFIMAAACLDACNIEEYDAYQPEVPEMPVAGAVTLTAGINEDAATKVSLGDDSGSSTKVLWSKGDSFALVDGGKRYVFLRNDQSEAELASAEFTYNEEEGDLPDISKEGLKFVYPCVTPAHYSAQSGTEEGLSDFMGMEAAIPENVSEWQGMSLNFRHTTAVVKMVLSNEAFKDAEVEVKLYAEGLLPDGNMISTGKLQGDSQGCVTAYVVVPVTGNNLNDCTIYVKTADNVYETTLGGNTMQAGKMYKVTKSNLTESTQDLACHLPDGGVFNSAVKAVLDANASLVKIKFVAGSSATGTEIADCGAYMVENGDCLEIHTAVLEFEFNQDCSVMFGGLEKITEINFNHVINTSNVIYMRSMFSRCSSLTTLDLRGFDTSNVTDMGNMFNSCYGLTTLDVAGFDTSNVTYMGGMFYWCSSLTTLDVSGFDTSNVTVINDMFSNCFSLTTLDVSGFDTSNVTDMSDMFSYCSSLTTLDVSSFDTSNVTDMNSMFSNCSRLTTLDVTGFDTSNVTSMGSMFGGCPGLTTLDVTGFDTSNVTDMIEMFCGCSGLTTLDVAGFDTSNVTDMGGMFAGCSGLTTLDVSSFDTSNVTNMTWMFSWCSSLTSLDVSGFDTSNVGWMDYMFAACSGLTTLDVSSFDTSNVTDMDTMFYDCSRLTTLDVTGFDTSNVTDMGEMFAGCLGLTTLDVAGFDTSNVTDMGGMFFRCSGLTTLDVSGFDTSNVTNMSYMFCGCSSLTTLDVSGFDTSNVADMSYMFDGCYELKGLDLRWFDFSKVTSFSYMFYDLARYVEEKPIEIKVKREGYINLKSNDTGLNTDYAELVIYD